MMASVCSNPLEDRPFKTYNPRQSFPFPHGGETLLNLATIEATCYASSNGNSNNNNNNNNGGSNKLKYEMNGHRPTSNDLQCVENNNNSVVANHNYGGSGMNNMAVPPKKRPRPVPSEQKDDAYWDRRKKNNDSAKRSRDARRTKEEQIAMRVVYLEQDNLQLRTEVSLLRSEIEKLRCMLYNP